MIMSKSSYNLDNDIQVYGTVGRFTPGWYGEDGIQNNRKPHNVGLRGPEVVKPEVGTNTRENQTVSGSKISVEGDPEYCLHISNPSQTLAPHTSLQPLELNTSKHSPSPPLQPKSSKIKTKIRGKSDDRKIVNDFDKESTLEDFKMATDILEGAGVINSTQEILGHDANNNKEVFDAAIDLNSLEGFKTMENIIMSEDITDEISDSEDIITEDVKAVEDSHDHRNSIKIRCATGCLKISDPDSYYTDSTSEQRMNEASFLDSSDIYEIPEGNEDEDGEKDKDNEKDKEKDEEKDKEKDEEETKIISTENTNVETSCDTIICEKSTEDLKTAEHENSREKEAKAENEEDDDFGEIKNSDEKYEDEEKVDQLESRIKTLENNVLTLKKQLFSSSLKVCNQEKLIRGLRAAEKDKLSSITLQLLELQSNLQRREKEISNALLSRDKRIRSQSKLIEEMMLQRYNTLPKTLSSDRCDRRRNSSGRSEDSDSGVVVTDSDYKKEDIRVIRSISDVVKNSRVGKLFSRELLFSHIAESETDSTLSINTEIEFRKSELFLTGSPDSWSQDTGGGLNTPPDIRTPTQRAYLNHRGVVKPKDVKYRRITKTKSRSMEELREKLRIESLFEEDADF